MQKATLHKKVLITVMTYPHPSQGYLELICTAGITEEGQWIRLYPIDYRYRSQEQKFQKWQWIEVDLLPRNERNDPRVESYSPDLDSIRILGDPLGCQDRDRWRLRRRIIDNMPHYTKNQLEDLYERSRISLGIVRPTKVHDLEARPADRKWKPEHQAIFEQFDMFRGKPKALRKLPYTFHYVFECEDSNGKTHTAMNEDWELGVLFLKEIDRLGSEQAALDSVRHNFFEKMCQQDRDLRFFMGTRFPYNTWLVVGTFWPPKAAVEQDDLFDDMLSLGQIS